MSIKTRAELALARAKIAESKGLYANGVVVPKADIAAMNMAEKVLKARSCQLELIYARRHEQRSISEHARLEAENAKLRAEVAKVNEVICEAWFDLACADIPDALDTLEGYAKQANLKLPDGKTATP